MLQDSSAAYEVDGRGPYIELRRDSLFFRHTFHRGYDELVYKFDLPAHKYKLVQVEHFVAERFKATPGWNEYWYLRETYNIRTEELTVKSENTNRERKEEIGSRQRFFSRPIPKEISLWLPGLKDPGDFYSIFELGEADYKYFEY